MSTMIVGANAVTRANLTAAPRTVVADMPMGSIENLLTAALTMRLQQTANDQRVATARVQVTNTDRSQQLADALAAEQAAQKAADDAKHDQGILGAVKMVGAIAGLVASAAAMCVSGGVTVLGVAACAGALCSLLSQPLADATHDTNVGIGFAATGAAISLGAGIASWCGLGATAASAASAASSGGQAAAGAATTATSTTSAGMTTFQSVARGVEIGAHIVSATSTGVGGLFEAAVAVDNQESTSARADQKEAEKRSETDAKEVDQILGLLKQLERSREKALTGTSDSLADIANEKRSIASRIGRV